MYHIVEEGSERDIIVSITNPKPEMLVGRYTQFYSTHLKNVVILGFLCLRRVDQPNAKALAVSLLLNHAQRIRPSLPPLYRFSFHTKYRESIKLDLPAGSSHLHRQLDNHVDLKAGPSDYFQPNLIRIAKEMASTTKLVGVIPAPPGQVANFVNPATKTGSNIALHTVMLFFVTLCVGIRLYTRQYITRQLGLDDCKRSLTKLFPCADICKYRFVRPRFCMCNDQKTINEN